MDQEQAGIILLPTPMLTGDVQYQTFHVLHKTEQHSDLWDVETQPLRLPTENFLMGKSQRLHTTREFLPTPKGSWWRIT